MVFPVVMYGCESWTVKKAEHQRIDAFELWCWRRLLRVPWTARRSLPTWCEEPTHLKRTWCWERFRAEEGDNRGWDGWMAWPTQWTWAWWTLGIVDGQGVLTCCGSWDHKNKKSDTLSEWTELYWIINGCWILSTAFYASIEIIIWFLCFSLLIWYITLISLHILKNPCIPGINPTWSWCSNFLMCC